jgi:hypothetical protein
MVHMLKIQNGKNGKMIQTYILYKIKFQILKSTKLSPDSLGLYENP